MTQGGCTWTPNQFVRGLFYAPTFINPHGLPHVKDPYDGSFHWFFDRDIPLLQQMGATTLFLQPWEHNNEHGSFLRRVEEAGLCVVPSFDISPWRNWTRSAPEMEEKLRNDVKDFLGQVTNETVVSAIRLLGFPRGEEILSQTTCTDASVQENWEDCEIEGSLATGKILGVVREEVIAMAPDRSLPLGLTLSVDPWNQTPEYLQKLLLWLEKVVGCTPLPDLASATLNRPPHWPQCAHDGRGYFDFLDLQVTASAENSDEELTQSLKNSLSEPLSQKEIILDINFPAFKTDGTPDHEAQRRHYDEVYELCTGGTDREDLIDNKTLVKGGVFGEFLGCASLWSVWSTCKDGSTDASGHFVATYGFMHHCIAPRSNFTFAKTDFSLKPSHSTCAILDIKGGVRSLSLPWLLFTIALSVAFTLEFWRCLKRCCRTVAEEGRGGKLPKKLEDELLADFNRTPYGKDLAAAVANKLQEGHQIPKNHEHLINRNGWGLSYDKDGRRYLHQRLTARIPVCRRIPFCWRIPFCHSVCPTRRVRLTTLPHSDDRRRQKVDEQQEQPEDSDEPEDLEAQEQELQAAEAQSAGAAEALEQEPAVQVSELGEVSGEEDFKTWLAKQSDWTMAQQGCPAQQEMRKELIGVNTVTGKRMLETLGVEQLPGEVDVHLEPKNVPGFDSLHIKVTINFRGSAPFLAGALHINEETDQRRLLSPSDCKEDMERFLRLKAKLAADVQAKILGDQIKQEVFQLKRERARGDRVRQARARGERVRQARADVRQAHWNIWCKCFQEVKHSRRHRDKGVDLHVLFGDLFLLHLLQVLGQHLTHAPHHLYKVFERCPPTVGPDGVIECKVDYDLLSRPMEDFMSNSDPFIPSTGQGVTFDDMDSGKLGEPVKKGYREPIGVEVLANYSVNFQWVVTIALWLGMGVPIAADQPFMRAMLRSDPNRKPLFFGVKQWLQADFSWAAAVKFLELLCVSRAEPMHPQRFLWWSKRMAETLALLICLSLAILPAAQAASPAAGLAGPVDIWGEDIAAAIWFPLRLLLGTLCAQRWCWHGCERCQGCAAWLRSCLWHLLALFLVVLFAAFMLVNLLVLSPERVCQIGDSESDFCRELEEFPWLPPQCVTCMAAMVNLWLLALLSALMIPYFAFDLLGGIGGSFIGAKRGFTPSQLSKLKVESDDGSLKKALTNPNLTQEERKTAARDASELALLEVVVGKRWKEVLQHFVESLFQHYLIDNQTRELLQDREKSHSLESLSSAARDRIEFFFQSLRAIITDGSICFNPERDQLSGTTASWPSLTQIIPVFREDIFIPVNRDDVRDVCTLVDYLAATFPSEWKLFAASNAKTPEELLQEINKGCHRRDRGQKEYEDAVETDRVARLWQARHSQSVFKTVEGAVQYQRAVQVLQPSWGRLPQQAQLIVAHQTYGQSGGLKQCEKDVHEMLSIFCDDQLEVCIDFHRQKSDSHLVNLVDKFLEQEYREYAHKRFAYASVLIEYDRNPADKDWPVKIKQVLIRDRPLLAGSNRNNRSQGKASNQLAALFFARGHYLQMLDANMGCDAEEAFKVPLVLRYTRGQARERGVVITGFPERIFTESHGLVGKITAAVETTFGGPVQRFLEWLGVRMHYGHPDFMCTFFARCHGSVSKASPHINLSEDIFMGFTTLLHDKVSAHLDFLRFDKAREVVFLSASGFNHKIASGAVSVLRSLDLLRLCAEAGPGRSFKLYFASVGFFVQNLLVDYSLRLYVTVFLLLSISSVTLDDLGQLDEVLTAEWVLAPIVGMLVALIRGVTEKNPVEGFKDCVIHLVFLPYHIFMNKTVASAVEGTIFSNRAAYVETGRPAAFKTYTLTKAFKAFWKSHYMPAVGLLWVVTVYWISQKTFMSPMTLVAVAALSWILAPVLYRPPSSRPWQDYRECYGFILRVPLEQRPVDPEVINEEEASLSGLAANYDVKRSERPYGLELFCRLVSLAFFGVVLPASIGDHMRIPLFLWALGACLGGVLRLVNLHHTSGFLLVRVTLVVFGPFLVGWGRLLLVSYDTSLLLLALLLFFFISETVKMCLWSLLPILWSCCCTRPSSNEEMVRFVFDLLGKDQLVAACALMILLVQAVVESILDLPCRLRSRVVLGRAGSLAGCGIMSSLLSFRIWKSPSTPQQGRWTPVVPSWQDF